MLTKERVMKLAERQVREAKINMENHYRRANISEVEKQNLADKYEYARIVYKLVREHYKEV